MTTTQQSLFDIQLADTLKENGINQVEQNANQQWLDEAFKIVEMLSVEPFAFTSDDVWELLNELHPDLDTHNHSAMGAVFRKASKQNLCVPTGQYVKSKRPSAQGRELKVWVGI
jgi:hypothetical protein